MTQTASPIRQGRESRRARARAPIAKYPYIRRRHPPIELLSTEAVVIIEANAEKILGEIGIEFRRDPESLRLWREAGADVQGERVHIPWAWHAGCWRPRPRNSRSSPATPSATCVSAVTPPSSLRWADRRSSATSTADAVTEPSKIS